MRMEINDGILKDRLKNKNNMKKYNDDQNPFPSSFSFLKSKETVLMRLSQFIQMCRCC